MSDSPKAILAFGYDLGSYEFGWNFNYKPTSKFRDVIEKHKFHGEAIENYLLEKHGFTEDPAVHVQGYWARRNAALSEIGVQVVRYGSPQYPGYILASKIWEVDDYGSKNIGGTIYLDLKHVNQINKAYAKLNIISTSSSFPSWILAAFYG